MNKKELLLTGFRDLYNKMAWLNNIKMNRSFGEFTSAEVHFIEYVGENPDSNVTKLANAFYMTRGGASKMSKKLIKKGVIESYQKVENNKEIYFKLTPAGEAIYKTHRDLHKEFEERDNSVFEQITEEQFDSMLRFIAKYSNHLDSEIAKER